MATNIHEDITISEDIHVAKGYTEGLAGYVPIKNEKDSQTFEKSGLLPPMLAYVDGNAAPDTEVSGDIYVIQDDAASGINAGWDGASPDDWVRFDGTAWSNITPYDGVICYDSSARVHRAYEPNQGWYILGQQAYGGYYMLGNATATTIAVSNTYYKVLGGTTKLTDSRGFSMNGNNRMEMPTGEGWQHEKVFTISVNGSIIGGNVNDTVKIAIYKNGAAITGAVGSIYITDTARDNHITAQSITTIKEGDYIEIYIKNVTNATNLTMSDLTVIIK